MSPYQPNVIVLGGPNGAGKSTLAPKLLGGSLDVVEFVNADLIAQEISGRSAEAAALLAGRIMLKRIEENARQGIDFAFETTLASRTLASPLRRARDRGYRIRLVSLWLDHPNLAVARVRERSRSGGHDVPEETIRRRYRRGLQNFFGIYRPLADHWRFYDNSLASPPRLIAIGGTGQPDEVIDERTWERARSSA